MNDLNSVSPPHPLIDFWPRFILFPILAVLLYPLFILGWGGEGWLVQTAWILVLTFCWFCVAGAFHEASHHTLFRRPAWNIWYGRLLGMMIGIPYTVYKESHRRHHAYLNTVQDYELWPYSDPGCSLTFRRFFVWLDIIAGVFTAPYIYGRIYFDKDSGLNEKVRRTIFWEYISGGLFWLTIIGGLVLLALQTGFPWSDFHFIWILPLMLSPCINTIRKFVEHLGMTSTEPISGTRTIVPRNLLSRMFCYFNFDIAVHGPHHRYPKAHHYELETKMHAYLETHPETSVPQFNSYFSAICDMVPCLWKRPATGNHDLSNQTSE